MDQTERLRLGFQHRLVDLCARYASIAEVARACDLNRQQLNRYLRGDGLPSVMTLRLMATFFGVTMEQLLGGEPVEPPHRTAMRETVDPIIVDSRRGIRRGYYLEICNSSVGDGDVLVSLGHVDGDEPPWRYKRKMPIDTRHGRREDRWTFIGEVWPTELSTLIVYANRSVKLAYGAYVLRHDNLINRDMIGIKIASTPTVGGAPFANAVYFRHIGERPNLREALRRIGRGPVDSFDTEIIECFEHVRNRKLLKELTLKV